MAGSVDANTAPISSATGKATPKMGATAKATMTVVMRTPGRASKPSPTATLEITLNEMPTPPWNKIMETPSVKMSWAPAPFKGFSTMPSTDGPINAPTAVEEGIRVSDPVIVQTANPLDVKPEDLDALINALKDEGLDVRRAYLEQKGYGVTWWEVVLIWVAARSAETVIDRVVGDAVVWMKNRFRQNPESKRPKVALIVYYEGEEGYVVEKVQLKSADDEPIRKPTDEFERYTRRKPPEA
jgi:hypothetical protein